MTALQTLELSVLDWIQLHFRCGFLDAAMPLLSAVCDHGEVWIILAAVLLLCKRTRRTGLCLTVSLLLDLLCCNLLLKPLVGRARPFAVNTGVALLVAPPMDASFPSGHTASSFAAASALWRAKSPLRVPALVLAAAIALSRLYLYVHWPTDVLGGAVLGIALGYAGTRLTEALLNRQKQKN